jgi:hypothetical protein
VSRQPVRSAYPEASSIAASASAATSVIVCSAASPVVEAIAIPVTPLVTKP